MDLASDLNTAIGEDLGKASTKSLTYREKNELTSDLIKKQIGDIEQIRLSMGLNKKRMCELLLIDPSTWTRWCTGKTPVPPLVYRSLQWGLAVMDKHPEFHPLMISRTNSNDASKSDLKRGDAYNKSENLEYLKLREDFQRLKDTQKKLFLGLLGLGLLSIMLIVISFT